MDEYRVIFEWTGKPLTGFNVSDKMSLESAEYWYNKIKDESDDLKPEILKIVKV